MKNLLFTIFAFGLVSCFTMVEAQIETPSPSPFCKMQQTVGLTDVTLEYSRPSKRGRELFVDVEEFGKIWRTGANASTKITFSDDVKIEGKDIPAGTYAIYSIPSKDMWTVMLYNDLSLGGNVADYDKSKEAARFQVKHRNLAEDVETFTIHVGNFSENTADIALVWGTYYVPLKLEVDYDSRVMKGIEETLAGPSRSDYYSAASYYYETGRDLEKAHMWAKKANELGERYWQLRLQAMIEAKMGKYKEAIATAEKSSALAKEAGNEGYVKMNNESIKQWSSMK